jgi:Ser/Thr protein kinase RdoA (MazF antagonist)
MRAVTHSIPSTDSVREGRLPAFEIGTVSSCRLHMSGVNDVFVVEAETGRYVFKVYRHGWRSEANVRYELDLLAHLDVRGVPVSLPVRRRDGEPLSVLPFPEGERIGVLFYHAPGRQPNWPFYRDVAESRLLGNALAAIHEAAGNFHCHHERRTLDEAGLIDAPLAVAQPLLTHRPDDWNDLMQLVEGLRENLRVAASCGLSRGVCHGDFQCGNIFLNAGAVATFDFDACGEGWLAFDLARWRENARGPESDASWDAFLVGYRARRALTVTDIAAVPLFVRLRALHGMAIKMSFVARGQWDTWDNDFFWNALLAILRAPVDQRQDNV